ncbi:MAG: hypothetical protein JJ978_09050 [Roseivirga sp.]|jgi:hypothetical protein|uniref:hypothetical protein n=1 Tax=Roseivirga sp. TaxID=1964215 RepID=UPI001B026100|nr:hypothetical protein [Roseivirga sp.]MBO6495700.1 hypothetical protein [Roseivirga sp.]
MKNYFEVIPVVIDTRKFKSHEQKAPELIIGGDYYICFQGKKVHPCKLVNIDPLNKNYVDVKIQLKGKFKQANPEGELHSVKIIEIGSTPEGAVLNRVLKGSILD